MAHQTYYDLPNGWASTMVNAANVGAWIFNQTTGTIVAADTPGGAFALTGTAAETDLMEILGPLAYEVDAGVPIVLECEIQVNTDASSAAAVFVGFTDRKNATEEQTLFYEDAAIVSAATDAVGILLEREQDATWAAISVKNDVDGAFTPLTDAADVVTGTWQKLKVSIGASGDTSFYIDDKLLSHTRSAAITTSVRLAPVIAQDERNHIVITWVRNIRCYGPGAES